jgi:hypothetical protein
MMDFYDFSRYENVFTPHFRSQVRLYRGHVKRGHRGLSFVGTIGQSLSSHFHVLMPEAVLDIRLTIYADDDGWVGHEEGELILGLNIKNTYPGIVTCVFHEVKHLIDAYNGYPYVSLDDDMDVPGYEETFDRLGKSKYEALPEERRARRASEYLIEKAYKIYVRGQV